MFWTSVPPLSLQASRYLSYLVYPLCIGGAVFSLFYLRQRRWDSGQTRWLSGLTLIASAHSVQCKAAKCLFFFPFTVIIHGWSTLWWLVSSSACTPSAETDCVCDVFPWPTSACSPPLRSLRLWLPFNGASAICQLQGQSCVAMGIHLYRDCVNQQINDTSLCSYLLPGSAEVCGPPAKGRVDVQGEC